MLVLARKLGESLTIGDKIKVTIVRLSNETVRIGIDAPKDMNIVRSELYDRMKPANSSRVVAGSLHGCDSSGAASNESTCEQ